MPVGGALTGYLPGRRYPHRMDRPSSARRIVLPARPPRDRIASLQQLRAIAALLVLFQHITQMPAPAASAGSIFVRQTFGPLGSAGVDLFFVISGFVIAHGISADRAPPVLSFLLGRAIRILPLFWLMSVIYVAELLLAGVSISPTLWPNTITVIPLVPHRDYLYPILYVGWSLAFELAFYIMAGLMLMQARQHRVPALLGMLLGLAAIGAIGGASGGAPIIFTNAILIEFALGIVAWSIWRRGLSAPAGAGLAVIGLILFLSGLLVNVGQGFDTDPMQIVTNAISLKRAIVWGVPAALMLLGVVVISPAAGCGHGLLGRIGDASFSLYLVHPIVLFELRQIHLSTWISIDGALIPILFGLPIMVAMLVHHYIERPIMEWGKRLAARKPEPSHLWIEKPLPG